MHHAFDLFTKEEPCTMHLVAVGIVSSCRQAQASVQVHGMPAGDSQDSRGVVPAGYSSSLWSYLSAGAPLVAPPSSSTAPNKCG